MVKTDESICPACGGALHYYDKVKRIIREKKRRTYNVSLRRLQCADCGRTHRELPCYIFPYKQYDAEIIMGVLNGFITCETLGFEDYPCEITMQRWRSSQNLQGILRERKQCETNAVH